MNQCERGEFKPGGVIGKPKLPGAMTAGGYVSICPLCQGDKTILRPYKGDGHANLEERNCPVCNGIGTIIASPIRERAVPRDTALEIILASGFVLMVIAWFVV